MILSRVLRRSMASKTPVMEVSTFTKQVVASMRKLYPESLADKSFDNTGLLLEAPYQPDLENSVLLTIDLTTGVADEAIRNRNSVIIAYHPIIFRGLKSLTSGNTQQTTLLRLAQAGISVYCPHTALDAAPGGLNDWLANAVCSGVPEDECGTGLEREHLPLVTHTKKVINPCLNPPQGFEGAGYGRIVTYEKPQKLGQIMTWIMENLYMDLKPLEERGEGLNIALPHHPSYSERVDKKEILVNTVGICAGSGGSMLNGLDVDLLFTGELSHHEALEAVENGRCVITAGHSNTERGFLGQVLYRQLWDELAKARGYDRQDSSAERRDSSFFTIDVSEYDWDPYEMVRQKEWEEGDAGYGW